MAQSITMPMVGVMPKVKGSRIATAIEGETPGMAPPRMPTITPATTTRKGLMPIKFCIPAQS